MHMLLSVNGYAVSNILHFTSPNIL